MGKDDVPRERNLSNLKIFTQVLNQIDVEYFVRFGTLLGFILENNRSLRMMTISIFD